MFKRNKQLIIGFLLGAMLFSIVPVGATVQDYLLKKSEVKLIVDGKEFANKDLPVLIMEPGYNYIPAATFREICDTIGVGFEYVGDKKEIQIDTKKEELSSISENSQPSRQNDIIQKTKDNNIFLINGTEYIIMEGVYEYLRNVNKGKKLNEYIYIGPSVDGTHKLYTINGENIKTIIDDIPIKRSSGEEFNSEERIYYGAVYLIEYSYFQNTIIPLTK